MCAHWIFRAAMVAAFISLTSGCGSESNRYPVEGKVTLDGVAVSGATVLFLPENDQGPLASGFTGPDGTFVLASNDRNGVLPGIYEVVVTKTSNPVQGVIDPKDTVRYAAAARQALEVQQLLPVRYGDRKTSGLKITVPNKGKVALALESGG